MIFLTVAADLSDNIRNLHVRDTDDHMAEYCFEVECTQCHEPHDTRVTVNTRELHDLPGSRGEASLVLKCKFCGSVGSIKLEPFEQYLYAKGSEDEGHSVEKRKKHGLNKVKGDFAAILQMDCRGCQPIKFYWDNLTFVVTLSSGKQMECQFDQDENEWYDYDDDANEEVNITDFSYEFVKGK